MKTPRDLPTTPHGYSNLNVVGHGAQAPPVGAFEPARGSVAEAAAIGAVAQSLTLVEHAAVLAPQGAPITLPMMKLLRAIALERSDAYGRVTPTLQAELTDLERTRSHSFDAEAAARFQTLVAEVGGKMEGAIRLPEIQSPIWTVMRPHPLADFRSTPNLPEHVDVAILGSGLGGAAMAYALASAARAGLRVAVLDRWDPATGASGGNGGVFELEYRGSASLRLEALQRQYPKAPLRKLWPEAKRIALAVLAHNARSQALQLDVFRSEGIEADLQRGGGWDVATSKAEERDYLREVKMMRAAGHAVRIAPPAEVFARFGFQTEFLAFHSPGDGSYHPFKFINGLFLRSLLPQGIQLYTRTNVQKVVSKEGYHELVTNRGTLRAGRVVCAMNAHAPRLFPELGMVESRRSQVAVFEHVPNRLRDALFEGKIGNLYWNQPLDGAYEPGGGRIGRRRLVAGGGQDFLMAHPDETAPDPEVHDEILYDDVYPHFPELEGQPPLRESIQAMGFTPDLMQIVSRLWGPAIPAPRKNAWMIGACCGHNGPYWAGAAAIARDILEGELPEEFPADVFGLDRFTRSLRA